MDKDYDYWDPTANHHEIKQRFEVTNCLDKAKRIPQEKVEELGNAISQKMENCMEDCSLFEEI